MRDLRDRALIGTLTYSFARIGAALKLKVEDLRPADTGVAAAGIADDRKGWLFRTSLGHTATVLTEYPMTQKDGWSMVRKHAVRAGITAPIGNHTFRATGITNFLENGGTLEHAQDMAAHASPRTTRLYDRRKERITQAQVERIRL